MVLVDTQRKAIAPLINARQQKILRELWTNGPLSRWELHERTGYTPNVVGSIVETMRAIHLISERNPEPALKGRPRVPLEIDPQGRHILGLAIVPGHVEITKLGLSGRSIGQPVSAAVSNPSHLISTAANLLVKNLSRNTLSVGITSTGFLDPKDRSVLLSSALPDRRGDTLGPIFEAAGDKRVVLQNDSHAKAARWFLTHRAQQRQDVLLVSIEDGRVGAALLVDGRPNRGCMTGGNELGHTRFPGIETERCFCGQSGCLERIFSSDFLSRKDFEINGRWEECSLPERIRQFTIRANDPALSEVIHLLAQSLSNAINLLRIHRLVLVSPFSHMPNFNRELIAQTRALALPGLAERIQIDLWDQPTAGDAENAAWLVLAELIYGGWNSVE